MISGRALCPSGVVGHGGGGKEGAWGREAGQRPIAGSATCAAWDRMIGRGIITAA